VPTPGGGAASWGIAAPQSSQCCVIIIPRNGFSLLLRRGADVRETTQLLIRRAVALGPLGDVEGDQRGGEIGIEGHEAEAVVFQGLRQGAGELVGRETDVGKDFASVWVQHFVVAGFRGDARLLREGYHHFFSASEYHVCATHRDDSVPLLSDGHKDWQLRAAGMVRCWPSCTEGQSWRWSGNAGRMRNFCLECGYNSFGRGSTKENVRARAGSGWPAWGCETECRARGPRGRSGPFAS